jgi:hypothetical protein
VNPSSTTALSPDADLEYVNSAASTAPLQKDKTAENSHSKNIAPANETSDNTTEVKVGISETLQNNARYSLEDSPCERALAPVGPTYGTPGADKIENPRSVRKSASTVSCNLVGPQHLMMEQDEACRAVEVSQRPGPQQHRHFFSDEHEWTGAGQEVRGSLSIDIP